MITLYLARHGQTEENIARIFQGHMPGTLTVEGIAQAEALRDTLRNISLDAVVSSDLKRCVDTARIAVEGPWMMRREHRGQGLARWMELSPGLMPAR